MREPFRVVTFDATGPAMRRTFVMLCLGTALMFVFTGLMTMYQAEREVNASSDLRKWVTRFSTGTLFGVMGQEVPFLSASVQASESISMTSLFFQMLTSVNPEDPRSYLGRELPGFELFDGEFLVRGDGVDYTDAPIESPPPSPDMKPPELKEGVAEQRPAEETEEAEAGKPSQTTDGKKRVFIYHTHWYESFLPYLETDDKNKAQHPEKNITKVGKQFAEELEKIGIGAEVSDKSYDYVDRSQYYAESGKTVQEAMANDDHLQYFFDIHRDSQPLEKTLVDIDGETYARVLFVIGKGNKNYEENYKLAKRMHEKLQELYPGLSRGIYSPKGKGVNGVYNQDISPRSLLIEVGGVENQFEEMNRTARALAEAFADIYWDAEPVDAQAE